MLFGTLNRGIKMSQKQQVSVVASSVDMTTDLKLTFSKMNSHIPDPFKEKR